MTVRCHCEPFGSLRIGSAKQSHMHIPDGFLNIPVSACAAAVSLGGLALAIRNVQKKLQDRLIPLMGVLAAFIFAAQMFNFPVAGGTSGHLLGGVLAAIVVGPWAATVVLTCVLIVQCLLFQDGGLIALGANILNMAIIGTWGGWTVMTIINSLPFVRGGLGWGRSVAIFLGAWFSVVVASIAAALELAISGTAPLTVTFVAMAGIHAIIGVGEGIITLLIVSFLKRVKPELLSPPL